METREPNQFDSRCIYLDISGLKRHSDQVKLLIGNECSLIFYPELCRRAGKRRSSMQLPRFPPTRLIGRVGDFTSARSAFSSEVVVVLRNFASPDTCCRERSRGGCGPHMYSTGPLFAGPMEPESAHKFMKLGSLEVVAREGIEPPTPAFSGLRSTS